MAPRPAAVLALDGVVQHPTAQRRNRTRGIEIDGSLQDLVKGGERFGTSQEGLDVRALLVVDPGGYVHQQEAAHELRMTTGQRDGRDPSERHADHGRRLGGQPADDGSHVIGHGRGLERFHCLRPVGVSMAGEVDGQQRPIEGQCHRVPGMGVLPTPVQQDQLRADRTPHQRTEPSTGGDLDGLAADGRCPLPLEPGLAGVLRKHGELVVGRGRSGGHVPEPIDGGWSLTCATVRVADDTLGHSRLSAVPDALPHATVSMPSAPVILSVRG